MLEATDQPHAHWDLISAEDKHYARVAVLETLIDRWVHDLERRGLDVPERPRRRLPGLTAPGADVWNTVGMDSRYGITIPFDGITLAEHREWFPRIADLGYSDLVVRRGRRRRRLHAARRWPRLGAAAQTGRRGHAGLHPWRRHCSP